VLFRSRSIHEVTLRNLVIDITSKSSYQQQQEII
jgi:hypothetical protein